MADPSVAEVVLNRGVLPLLSYYANHPSVCKMLLKRLIILWATSEKRVRVVAFVAIFRLAQNLPPKPLEWVLKVMDEGCLLCYIKTVELWCTNAPHHQQIASQTGF